MDSAQEVIDKLQMEKHPNGGWFAPNFREKVFSGRPALTSIYYLLEKGDRFGWHKVDAYEVWHFYAGAPMEITITKGGKRSETLILGLDLDKGQMPQIIVPSFHWQTTVSLGDWSFAGCTVAPGFTFTGYRIAPEDWGGTGPASPGGMDHAQPGGGD